MPVPKVFSQVSVATKEVRSELADWELVDFFCAFSVNFLDKRPSKYGPEEHKNEEQGLQLRNRQLPIPSEALENCSHGLDLPHLTLQTFWHPEGHNDLQRPMFRMRSAHSCFYQASYQP